MKHKVLFPFILSLLSLPTEAQTVSCASQMTAQPKADVTVPFRVTDEGVATPIEWGLDLAWLSEDNVRRGILFAGKDIIDIIRTSFMPTASVAEGQLSNAQIRKVRERANIIKKYAKEGVALNLNDDHASVDPWYNENSATVKTAERGKRWAQVIDLHIKQYAALGLTNFVSISPFNEPDFGWDQGYASTRMSDFLNVCKSLRNDFDGAYDGVRLCGGNTLNDDKAYEWWNYLKSQIDEGNTHQLAGDFDHYASFFQGVRRYGHHATADELHNTMEAMVGVEYGMQTGIWWGTCEHSRSQFMKATYQGNPGKRLAYGEHRNNWTAASLYRHTDGTMQAFGGTSERQAVATKFGFVSLDRPVWFNGLPGREYVMSLPGGTGYQQGQTNAETVVDVQSGVDIMPHIDGTYKIVNMRSGMLLGFTSNPGSNWVTATQRKDGTQAFLQWNVKPVAETIGGDFSYYTLSLNTENNVQLDILNWGLTAGSDVGGFPGGLGNNEQWFLEYAGNGAFYIRSKHSAMCLEVKSGSKSAGANVQMGVPAGRDYQQWRFLPVDVTPDLKAPSAPSGLQAQKQAASVRLTWNASAEEDVASYTILRSEDGTDFYAIAVGITATDFTDNEADDAQLHHYQVYAVDKSLNYSERTQAVTATPSGEPSCIMQLDFDNTLYDATPQGNHAAYCGTPAWGEGYLGTASASLNGKTQYMRLAPTVANHDALTISCWAYWSGGSAWQRIWDFGNGESQYMFLTPKSDSGIRFAIKNGGAEETIRVSRSMTLRKWTHLCLTLDAEGAKLYMNGSLVGQNDNLSIRPKDFRPVLNFIGRSQFAADPLFNGSIDDFRIYNYSLTAEQVAQLAGQTNAVGNIELDKAVGAEPVEEKTFDLSGRPVMRSTKGLHITRGRKSISK